MKDQTELKLVEIGQERLKTVKMGQKYRFGCSLVIQNLYFGVESVKTYSERVDAAIERTVGSLLLYLTCKQDVLRDAFRRYGYMLNRRDGNLFYERLRLGMSNRFNLLGVDPRLLKDYLYMDEKGNWCCRIPWLFGDEIVSVPDIIPSTGDVCQAPDNLLNQGGDHQ